MGASRWGPSAFDRARGELLSRLMRKSPRERWLVVSTSPVRALSHTPLDDAGQLRQALQGLSVTELPGHLDAADRIGRALLGGQPDRTVILTDEPRPRQTDPRVEFQSIGEPLPNVAIVGLEADDALCLPQDSQVMVTVQNSPATSTGSSSPTTSGGTTPTKGVTLE